MNQKKNNKYEQAHRNKLRAVGDMLREMRFAEGLRQADFIDYDLSRRQIQRGEYGSNLTLVQLFKILECFDYSVHEFFEAIE